MSETKYCVHCKHCVLGPAGMLMQSDCTKTTGTSAIRFVAPQYDGARRCYETRADVAACGPEGKWFEARPIAEAAE